jgi:uncharacterized protein
MSRSPLFRAWVISSPCALIFLFACSPKPRFSVVPALDASSACVGPGALPRKTDAKNVDGSPLAACPSQYVTGFHRNGYCNTGAEDRGVHVVCAKVSEAFLSFSRNQGNDLMTPSAGFPGLKPGDAWCLCAARWREANEAGVAPEVYREATDSHALDLVSLDALKKKALALPVPE